MHNGLSELCSSVETNLSKQIPYRVRAGSTRWGASSTGRSLPPLIIQVIANSSSLEVAVSEERAVYTCRVTVKNYPEKVKQATVWRKGPARILPSKTPGVVLAR